MSPLEQGRDEGPTETTALLDEQTSNDSKFGGQRDGGANRIYDGRDGDDVEVGSVSPASTASSIGSTIRASLQESVILLKGSVPVILAYALQNSLQTASILIVGRLSPQALAVAAFSYMFASSTAWLVALGGTTAIDTLASASFTGSKNPHEVGIILQRAFIVLAVFYIPIVLIWVFSEPILLALGQEAWLARDAQRFLVVLSPFGLGYIYFECMKKFLQAQEIMRGGTYVTLIVAPLNALMNYLFVYTFDLGLLGAPLATGINYWLAFFLLVGYTRFFSNCHGWGGWSRACLRNTWTFARLALLGVINVGTEWWAFEIVALLAGTLGTLPLASQSVLMTADQIFNTIPLGVSVATSARIGNLLGRRAPASAKVAAHTATFLAITFGTIVLTILMLVKDDFARLFNNDAEVIALTARVLPYVALFQIADGIVNACSGVLRGMGRQHIGAAVNVICYYCGALPFGAWLAFHGWGLQGLWIGQCIALYLVGAVEWIIVAFSNWDKQVENALGRLDADSKTATAGAVDAGDAAAIITTCGVRDGVTGRAAAMSLPTSNIN